MPEGGAEIEVAHSMIVAAIAREHCHDAVRVAVGADRDEVDIVVKLLVIELQLSIEIAARVTDERVRQVDAVYLGRAVRVEGREASGEVVVQLRGRDAERGTLAVEQVLVPDLAISHAGAGGECIEVELVALVEETVDVESQRATRT